MQFFIVYSFQSTIGDFNIKCNFINSKKFQRDGADHSASSGMRRDWAHKIVNFYNSQPGGAQQKIWYPLPVHDYKTYLERNGFQYDEFYISVINETNIEIMIRPRGLMIPQMIN